MRLICLLPAVAAILALVDLLAHSGSMMQALDQAKPLEDAWIVTTALLVSRSNATGAQITRSPALGVIRLSTRLTAANVTTSYMSQRDTRDQLARTSPARAITTAAIPTSSMA